MSRNKIIAGLAGLGFVTGLVIGAATREDKPVQKEATSPSQIEWIYFKPDGNQVTLARYDGTTTQLGMTSGIPENSEGIDNLVQRANPCATASDLERLRIISANLIGADGGYKDRENRKARGTKIVVAAFDPSRPAQELFPINQYPIPIDPSLQHDSNGFCRYR